MLKANTFHLFMNNEVNQSTRLMKGYLKSKRRITKEESNRDKCK
ncbi:F15O4.1 [Arabidopsis thaliana]|uniref:F15O4.1 n=1 Tax=Arabidopsis thaliana TaxID=3702 RepID=Q9LQI3_ARATH|nr:F15O4.1 [Arabidopsis thaliana]